MIAESSADLDVSLETHLVVVVAAVVRVARCESFHAELGGCSVERGYSQLERFDCMLVVEERRRNSHRDHLLVRR